MHPLFWMLIAYDAATESNMISATARCGAKFKNFAHQECADWTLRVHLTFAHRCVRRLMMPASLN
jgi:hypothetical protein